MKKVIIAISLAAMAGLAFAQSSQSAGSAGSDQSAPSAGTPGPGQGAGPGQGPRGRMMRFDKSNTPGWSLMTREERLAHRDKMHGFKTVEECKAYHDEHLKKMEERAKEKGQSFKPWRGDPCTLMQQRGFIK